MARAPRFASPLKRSLSASRCFAFLSASPRYRPPRVPMAFQLKSSSVTSASVSAVAMGRTPSSLTSLWDSTRRRSVGGMPVCSSFCATVRAPTSPMRHEVTSSEVSAG